MTAYLIRKKKWLAKNKKSQIYVAGDAYVKKDGGMVVKQKRIELEMNIYEEIWVAPIRENTWNASSDSPGSINCFKNKELGKTNKELE